MTTPNPDVVEAVAGSLCAWFERTQDAHNEKFPVVCSFHKDEAEALLHDLASQGIELVKRGDVLTPWIEQALREQQQALFDIREHVRRYNGKPFLPKDVATRIESIHAQPWYPSNTEGTADAE